jgi:hypothetical protein
MSTNAASKLVLPVSERDHVRGPAQASVTLVEYGDLNVRIAGKHMSS